MEALEASGWLDTSGPTPPPRSNLQDLPRPSLEAALAEAEALLLPLHHRLACHGVCRGASRRGAPSEALSKSTSCGTLGPVRGCVLRSVSLWMSPVYGVWGGFSYGCGAGPGKLTESRAECLSHRWRAQQQTPPLRLINGAIRSAPLISCALCLDGIPLREALPCSKPTSPTFPLQLLAPTLAACSGS